MPSLAVSKRPARSRTAPVKAPRTWPKSSLSSSSPGRAAALTATKGPLRRGEWAWMMRAMTSLPVPLSPVMRTVDSLCCSVSMSRKTRAMALERAIRPKPPMGPLASTVASSAGRSTTRKRASGSQTPWRSRSSGAAETDMSRAGPSGPWSTARQPSRFSPASSAWRSGPSGPKSSAPSSASTGRSRAAAAAAGPSSVSSSSEA